MAVSVSTPLADHVERLDGVPTPPDPTEVLTSEGLIDLKLVIGNGLYPRGTHISTVRRHGLKGVQLPDGTVLRLEIIRIGGGLFTSRAAVLRFFAAQNPPAPAPAGPPVSTPAARSRAAAAASKKLDRVLGSPSAS